MTTRRTFTREFKVEAVKRITAQGLWVAEVARQLGVAETVLRKWKVAWRRRGDHALPGHGQRPPLEAELHRAARRESAARGGAGHPPKSDGVLRQGVAVRYRYIEDLRRTWPVRTLGAALGVRASGYSAWRGRPPGARPERRSALLAAVRAVHAKAKARSGSPRVHAELRAQGHGCTVRTVAELMRAAGIAAKTRRKFRATTNANHDRPVAANLLDRRFAAVQPDTVWVADITDVPTREGWLSLAVVEDLHARRVVGWSMDATMTSRLVVDALAMAVQRRRPGADLLAHSDRGSQYASEHDQRLLGEHGITCSMSRRGNCWDNAPAESFFATRKKELTHHEDYAIREAARASIFEDIEVFYNRERRHSALGDQSPVEFEAATAG